MTSARYKEYISKYNLRRFVDALHIPEHTRSHFGGVIHPQ